MNRLTYAWNVLRNGVPEPEPVYIVGEPAAVQLYTVHLYDWKWYSEIGPRKVNNRWKFFQTCEQAHAEYPDQPIEKTAAIKAGGRFYFNNRMREIEVQPKPKVAKGKRKGAAA